MDPFFEEPETSFDGIGKLAVFHFLVRNFRSIKWKTKSFSFLLRRRSCSPLGVVFALVTLSFADNQVQAMSRVQVQVHPISNR